MGKGADLSTLLERLLAADVEFVLVGGLAAVVQTATAHAGSCAPPPEATLSAVVTSLALTVPVLPPFSGHAGLATG
jgi:hypothetical protein